MDFRPDWNLASIPDDVLRSECLGGSRDADVPAVVGQSSESIIARFAQNN